MQYRKDIDGLRSIAVLLVILNHVGFSFFPGGFIGVDVFFVISGFLITSIVAAKISANEFSLPWFFVRRIKRLLPVSFVVIGVTMLVSGFVMLPQDLTKFLESVIWVVFYLGNIFFWQNYGGYFGGAAQEAPLLHTWSLAVEEQYYFVWPLALLLCFKFFGRKLSLYILAVAFLVFLYLSELGTQMTFGAAYYLLPTRFFELMAGSLLALVWSNLPVLRQGVATIVSLAGAGLVLASAFLLTEHHTFPGYNAIYPVLGTVLLIYSAAGIVNKILSTAPFVFVGKISYSMYLWHWPVIAYINYTAIELSLAVQFFVIAMTIIVSYFSWRFVEQPFRISPDKQFSKVALKLFVAPALILSAIAYVGISNDGFPSRFTEKQVNMEVAFNTAAHDLRRGCHSPLRNSAEKPSENCIKVFNPSSQAPDVLVLGDSHANHFIPFLYELAEEAQLNVLDYTLDQCMPVFGVRWGRNEYKADMCKGRNDLAKEYISQNNVKYVVLAASWPGEGTTKLFAGKRLTDTKEKRALLEARLSDMVAFLSTKNIKVILLEDTPDLGGKSAKCPIQKELFKADIDCTVVRPINHFVSEIFADVKNQFANVAVIKMREFICEGELCVMEKAGIPLFRDDDHLNVQGSALLGREYRKLYANPFDEQ